MQNTTTTSQNWRVTGYHSRFGIKAKYTETISAPSKEEAERAARAGGMVGVTSAQESKFSSILTTSFGGKVKSADVVTTLRSIATGFDAGMAPLKVLQSAHEHSPAKGLVREALADIEGRVRAGEDMHKAFEHHHKVFGRSAAATIEAGLKSGKLREALNSLAESTERSQRIRGKIKNALVYPVIIVSMVLVAFVLGVVYVIPKLETTLKQLDSELPRLTQTLLDISHTIRDYPIQLLIAVIAAVSIYKLIMAQESVLLARSRLVLHLPVMGKLVKGLNSGTLCDLAGVLLTAGVSPNRVMELGASTLKNRHLADELRHIAPRIRAGDKFAQAMSKSVPPFDSMLVALADQSSSGIDDAGLPWRRYGNIKLEETERTSGTLTDALQPFILVFAGVLVLILAAAIYTPILSVYDAY